MKSLLFSKNKRYDICRCTHLGMVEVWGMAEALGRNYQYVCHPLSFSWKSVMKKKKERRVISIAEFFCCPVFVRPHRTYMIFFCCEISQRFSFVNYFHKKVLFRCGIIHLARSQNCLKNYYLLPPDKKVSGGKKY